MKVNCQHCNKVFIIPDERLPKGKKVTLSCTACSGKIILDLRSRSSAPDEAKVIEKKEALIKKILKGSKALPPMPQIMQKAFAVLDDPNASFKEIGSVLEADQAMASRVLKLSNSAYYGLSVPVSTVQQASALLGTESLVELITVVSTSKFMGKTLKGYGIASDALWRHSLAVAFGAKIIAARKNPLLQNDAFSAGLIHDSGLILLDEYILENKSMFDKIMADGKNALFMAEKQIFGFNHAEIASLFFHSWNIPKAQTTAIRYHHNPSLSDNDQLSYILHVSDSIAIMSENGQNDNMSLNIIENGAMKYLDFKDDDIKALINEMTESVNEVIQNFN